MIICCFCLLLTWHFFCDIFFSIVYIYTYMYIYIWCMLYKHLALNVGDIMFDVSAKMSKPSKNLGNFWVLYLKFQDSEVLSTEILWHVSKRERERERERISIDLRWLFTPRVLQFISLCHNMVIEIFCEIASSWLSGLGHWSCEPHVLSSNPPETFVKSYWNNFWK